MRPEADKPGRQAPSPRFLPYWAFALSLICGLAMGLAVTRLHGPLQRGHAAPWQLNAEARSHFSLAIALEYAGRLDLPLALNKLISLRPARDPWTELAIAACELGSRGYLGTESGIQATRYAVELYTAQGVEGCAERLLPPPAESAPMNKAPLESAADFATPQPTKPPIQAREQAPASRLSRAQSRPRRFEARTLRSYCDAASPALIEVYVVDYLGRGVPGQQIRVKWGEQASLFVSGLKADRGDAYADFQMRAGIDYTIDMPDAAEPLNISLRADACYTENRRTLKSYRVTFVEI